MTPYLKLPWPATPPVDPQWLNTVSETCTEPVYMWNFGSSQEVVYEQEFIQYFESSVAALIAQQSDHNIVIDRLQIFSTAPGHNRAIHADGRGQEGERDWAINWVDPALDNHWMIWYEPRDHARKPHVELTRADTPYLSWKLAECREIARVRIQGYYLINTAIPHTVVNRGSITRVAVSLRSKTATVTYQELYDILRSDG